MEDVFAYFVAIGAGLGIGITLGALPALAIWRYIKRKGAAAHGFKAAKART
ncbi:hypothetical protein [Paenibacillus sp. GCM10027626]|uniref:hypothetical protein n=1 Tax=Paenibacillus sp. GCM10027626 TaxID=3273411 RepID=UPI0036458C73